MTDNPKPTGSCLFDQQYHIISKDFIAWIDPFGLGKGKKNKIKMFWGIQALFKKHSGFQPADAAEQECVKTQTVHHISCQVFPFWEN